MGTRWVISATLAASVVAGVAQAQIAAPRIGGYVQARETYVHEQGVAFTLNRARLSAEGSLPNRFNYRFLVELESGATLRTPGIVSLREAIIRWTRLPLGIQAGQFKAPFSREYLIPVPVFELADFSAVVDTLAPKYEIGVQADYVLPFFGVAAGVFNGEGQNTGGNRDSTVLYIGRVAVRPIPQTTVAAHVAYYSEDSTRYGGDVQVEQWGVLLRAEGLGQRKTGRDRDDFGWYVLAGYRLFPWLQLLARQEDFQRPSIGEARRISATVGGFNIELPGGRTRFLANYVARKTGYPRVQRNSLIGQVQVRF
jgi:hypothetical protein